MLVQVKCDAHTCTRYFNLNGTSPGEGNTIADHSLELLCDHYAIGESTGSGIPTGAYEVLAVCDYTLDRGATTLM